MTCLGPQRAALGELQSREIVGAVTAVRGLSVLVRDLPVPVGGLVRLDPPGRGAGTSVLHGEVVGFDQDRSVVMLYDAAEGLSPGTPVVAEQSAQTVPVGPTMLGRVLDGFGRPLDGGASPTDLIARPLHEIPLRPLERARILEPLPTGVRAIDSMLTLGKGQRIGVFSGPGVGKSTLLASIARNTTAEVNVIALVGERGREVKDFIELALGEEGLQRSVLIVATSDESPLLRVRAAALACAVAESFRDAGADVLLMMDSITRLAQAQRQIGLAAGEQPATKGYPPSVFAMLPRLLERAGASERGGSITGLYTVLVEGDDLTEPISDASRGILDGHIALSRKLASRGHFPAIDLLESISRVADDVCDAAHGAARVELRRLIAAYAEAEELINIGAYAHGSNPDCDVSIAMKTDIDAFLRQARGEVSEFPLTCRRLIELELQAEHIRQMVGTGPTGRG